MKRKLPTYPTEHCPLCNDPGAMHVKPHAHGGRLPGRNGDMKPAWEHIERRRRSLVSFVAAQPGITSGRLIQWYERQHDMRAGSVYADLNVLLDRGDLAADCLELGSGGRTRRWYSTRAAPAASFVTVLGCSSGVGASVAIGNGGGKATAAPGTPSAAAVAISPPAAHDREALR